MPGLKAFQEIAQLNVKVTVQTLVKICENGNDFCFIGTRKSCSEMIALDMSKLSTLNGSNFTGLLRDYITIYVHKDNKLKGFSSACRLEMQPSAETDDTVTDGEVRREYRIVCGLGIKNLHVWTFTPPTTTSTTTAVLTDSMKTDEVKQPSNWTCICDVPTNGNTLECAEFVKGGTELLSRSSIANVRIWQLPSPSPLLSPLLTTTILAPTTTTTTSDVYEEEVNEPITKLKYEDVPNTNDAKVLFEKYAFGGTYSLAVVKFGVTTTTTATTTTTNTNSTSTTKSLYNRDDIHLPTPVTKASDVNDPNKRKRYTRTIYIHYTCIHHTCIPTLYHTCTIHTLYMYMLYAHNWCIPCVVYIC